MAMVSTSILEQIDQLNLTPRAATLRGQFFSTQPGVAAERVALATQSWQETEGEPLDIRFAKLLKRVVEGVPTPICRGQKLVGSQTKYLRGAYPHPDSDGTYLLPLLSEEKGKMSLGGPVEKGVISPEDFNILIEAAKFWKGKTYVDRVREVVDRTMGSWYEDLIENGTQRYEALVPGPACIWYERVVQEGLRSYIRECQERIQRWIDNQEDDVDKLHFYQAVLIACQAVITLAHRYAQQARQMAAQETDPAWKAELEEVARICEWVPENPPRTFREGLQGIILLHVALGLENTCLPPAGWGRVDRYLYPLFHRDLAEGRLTIEEAADLVADHLTYCARQEWVMELSWRDYMQKGLLNSIALGGTDKDGNDVSNELTYLILHMMSLVRFAEPHLALGWHKGTPEWLMRKALETNWRVGGGVPQFQNCETFVDLMVRRGVSLENARNWVSHGCSQIQPADQCTAMEPSYINISLCLDLALHNGVASKTGKRLGPQTGDPRTFKSFEEFYKAFQTQAEHLIKKQLWHDEIVDRVRGQHYRQPLASAFLPGCLEKGMDYAIGGLTHYRMVYKKDRGLIPAADSLTAVQKLVFQQKRLTMAELVAAIDSNFAGERGEAIRQMCLAAPKYGNDIDEADYMVRDVAKFTGNTILSQKNIWGYNYAINRNGQAWHFMAGKRLAALPNGRKAGEPLADGSLSATQGMDRQGPTALLNSALKADFKAQSLAGILTVKFPAPLFATGEVRGKMAALTEGFLEDGGTYIQYNILDAHMLREAQEHPERYRDLVVRVGGYSAYFVNLSREVQDEIILRTEHSLVGV